MREFFSSIIAILQSVVMVTSVAADSRPKAVPGITGVCAEVTGYLYYAILMSNSRDP